MKDGEQKIEVQGSIDLDLKNCRGRDCCAKFATGLNTIISHSSKSI